ncbi:MAG: translation initiation factor IF-2 [Saprospiraceae bacterium]|nr:translation initiation factor IF-2 [Saprospiraceae bacterium]
MAIKLIKVAKEFNVGLHTIVETLHHRGFNEVENKATADITDEMLDVLKKEFQKDLAIKQEADKLARPVLKKDAPATTGTPETPAPAPAPRPSLLSPRENAPKPAEPVQAPAEPKQVDVQETAPVQEEPPKRELPKPKILGRIDLEKFNTPPKKEAKPEPKPEPKQEPKPAPVEAVKPEPEKPTPAPDPQPAKEKPAPAAEVTKPATEPIPGGVAGGATDAPAPESEYYRAESPNLRGLKIMGKINLAPPKPANTGQSNDRRDNRGGHQRGGGQQGNNRGGQGGGGQQRTGGSPQGGQRSGTPQGGQGGSGQQNQGGGGNNADRHKRKRKVVSSQPVTAESLQNQMVNNQGEKKGRGRADAPKEVSQKQIEDQIRQTMARMGASASRKRQKIRRDKRDNMRERAEMAEQAQSDSDKILQVTEFIAVSDLASLMNVKPSDIIKACMTLGIFVSINQRMDAEIIEVVASEFGYEVKFISAEEQLEVVEEEADDPADLTPRQPIVTVMGHVDHGKTSLLDHIRSANVAAGEAGGITQHIGAYEVEAPNKVDKITFLDTPGHEAFTAMRARGAKVTDIAIIVIAADDNIMPQTREAISHAQAAGVPIVFAINKIDKAGADPERIKNELAQMNILVEEWGGKYQSQDISAKKGLNIDKLLEKVLLEAELLELKANPKRRAVGTVLEASLEKGLGYVSKVLIENGTINIGDPIIAGEHAGRVKALFNELGKKVKSAGPAQPVMVLGLPGAPQAGEKIKEAASDAEAKEIASKRAQIIREQSTRANKRISLEEIGRRLALGTFKELKVIVKGDVDGSVEALSDSLIKLSIEKVQVSVIHKAVGQIVDSDVMLASASDAIIIGFQVRPSITARKLAEREGVEIKMYSIIYEAIEEIKAAIEGMLEPTKEEEIMGQVEIREVYKISKVGTVAGCIVQEGKISRNHYIRVVRDGIVVYPANANQHAELASLKRFKEDAKEVKTGLECGLTIKNFNDIKPGDVVESYTINEVKAKL